MYQVNQTERRQERRRELPEGSANVPRPRCASYEHDTSFERGSFEEVCG